MRTFRFSSCREPRRYVRKSRAIVLVELIFFIGLGVITIGISWKLPIEAIYLQRIAAQAADRTAVMDSLTRAVRSDSLRAQDYAWADGTLSLSSNAADDAPVNYEVGPSTVRRFENGVETHAWSSIRLEFGSHLEHGAIADLLVIEFLEQPPPRATHLGLARHSLSVLLPGDRRSGE